MRTFAAICCLVALACGSATPTTSPSVTKSRSPVSITPFPSFGITLANLGPALTYVNVGSGATGIATAGLAITNFGTASVSTANWFVCLKTTCAALSCITDIPASLTFGGTLVCNLPATPQKAAGSVTLRSGSATGTIVSYVQWGSSGQAAASDAVTAGKWNSATAFVSTSGAGFTGVLVNYGAALGSFGVSYWLSPLITLPTSGTVTSSSIILSATTDVVGTYTTSSVFGATLGATITIKLATGDAATTAVVSAAQLTTDATSTLFVASGRVVVSGAALLTGTLKVAVTDVSSSAVVPLAISGSATLSGSLILDVTAVDFSSGATFTVCTYASLSIGYSSVTLTGTKKRSASTASVSCGATSCVVTAASVSPSATVANSTSACGFACAVGVGVGIGVGVPVVFTIILIIVCCCCCAHFCKKGAPRKTAAPMPAAAAPAPVGAAAAPAATSTSSGDYSGYGEEGYSGDY